METLAQSYLQRHYFGVVKIGRKYVETGPCDTRESAAQAAFALNPKAKTVSTGYGNFGAHFDIQWHDR